MEQGIEQGIQQGKKQKTIEMVKKLKKQKVDIKVISEVTGLSIEEIESLKN